MLTNSELTAILRENGFKVTPQPVQNAAPQISFYEFCYRI